MFGAPVLQNFDSTYLRLDATNDPLTGTLTTQAILPDVDITRNIGSPTAKFDRVFGGIGVFLKGGSNITFPVNAGHGGLVGGTQNGPGTTLHVLNGGGFAATMALGVCATTNAAGVATLAATKGGASAIGAAYAYVTGTATMQSTGYAATAMGYAYGPGISLLEATGAGAVCFGYAAGRSGTGTAIMRSTSRGSFTAGFARAFSGAGTALVEATAQGAFAAGYARTSDANAASIQATGRGSFAQGQAQAAAGGTAIIIASQPGAFAVGDCAAGQTINAGAINAAQFGPGTNIQIDSLQVGSAGIRFKGTLGIPAAPQNGDFWRVGNFVYVRSNNANIQIAGPGPLTN